MLKRMANYLRGYLKIRITGYSPERFLNLCKHKEISIWGLESRQNAYEMYITVSDFRKLKPILKKTRTKIEVQEKYGIPFFFHKYRKRKVFFGSIFLCMGLIYVLSLFIWNIEIEGNSTITDEVIIEYLETENVYHGMRRSKVDCEMIDTNIRKNFNDIIWVSASLEGCNIIIHIKENTDTFQVSQTEEKPGDIVSTAEGVITEIVTRAGVPCVSVGDSVKTGDILVSGIVEVKNDAGEVVRKDYKTADADIYAEVTLTYDELCEAIYESKEYTKKRYKEIYLNIYGQHISIGVKKTNDENYEVISQERQLKLNKNFRLPISYGENISKEYQLVEMQRSSSEIEEILNNKLELYCKKLEESGAVILEQKLQLTEEENGMRVSGYIKVKQSIGTTRKSVDF